MSTPSVVSPMSKLSLADLAPKQQDAITALYEKNTLLIAAKGLGKTVVGQTAVQELLADGVITRCLVLAPLQVCTMSWAGEWSKWQHLRQPALALGHEPARRMAIDRGGDIVVINFDNLVWLIENDLHLSFDGLLVDECTKLKTAGGSGFKALRKVLKHFTWRSAMTADPVSEQGVDLYAQMMLVDGGKTLGRHKDLFRRKYFYPTDFNQRKWAVLPGMDKVLANVVRDTVTVITDTHYDESLPPLRDIVVPVEMPAEGWQAYNAIMDDGAFDAGSGDVVLAEDAAAVAGKLQQITAGAAWLPGGKRYVRFHNAKLDALAKHAAQPDARPMLVAYWFRFELDALKERWPSITVLGETTGAVELWNAGKVPLLAVHPASCSHGLNLQYGGHDLAVLTAPWSADMWEQLVGRLRRRGQAAKFVARITFVVIDSIDTEVMARHRLKAYDSERLNAALVDA